MYNTHTTPPHPCERDEEEKRRDHRTTDKHEKHVCETQQKKCDCHSTREGAECCDLPSDDFDIYGITTTPNLLILLCICWQISVINAVQEDFFPPNHLKTYAQNSYLKYLKY